MEENDKQFWVQPDGTRIPVETTVNKSLSVTGLCWSRKKPTTPGYYWYKGKTGKPCVGHVKSSDDLWVKRRSGEWAGPIPEPTT